MVSVTFRINSLNAVDDVLADGHVGRGPLVAGFDDAGDALAELDGLALLDDDGFEVAIIRMSVFTGLIFFKSTMCTNVL